MAKRKKKSEDLKSMIPHDVSEEEAIKIADGFDDFVKEEESKEEIIEEKEAEEAVEPKEEKVDTKGKTLQYFYKGGLDYIEFKGTKYYEGDLHERLVQIMKDNGLEKYLDERYI